MISSGFEAPTIMLMSAGLAFIWRRRKSGAENPYPDALHLLLEGRKPEALEKLKETVKKNTDNIMAYILLGDLYREAGDASRAIRIHRNLLVRSDINEDFKDKTLQHLVQDYQIAGQLDRAIATAEQLYRKDKKNLELQQLLLDLYIQTGDWDKAFFHQQTLNRWQKGRGQDVLALFKVQAGLALTRKKFEHEGRIRFREAMKLDKKCIPAYLYLGDSYLRDGRDEDAFTVWRDFVQKQPENAQYAFNRLEEVLFDLGRYGEIESIYNKIANKKVKNESVYLRLIELYIKQGKIQNANQLYQERAEINPSSLQYRLIQIQLLSQNNHSDKALEQALHLLTDTISKTPVYECQKCQVISDEPLWYCPQCHEWNSYIQESE